MTLCWSALSWTRTDGLICWVGSEFFDCEIFEKFLFLSSGGREAQKARAEDKILAQEEQGHGQVRDHPGGRIIKKFSDKQVLIP